MWLTNAYARKTVVFSTHLENTGKFQCKCSLLFLGKDLHVGVTLNMWETAIYDSSKNGGKTSCFQYSSSFFSCLPTEQKQSIENF